MPVRKNSRSKKKRTSKSLSVQTESTKKSIITTSNSTVISVPNNISALNSEGYHHVLSDIYDYFENKGRLWENIIRISDIILGVGLTGIVSYSISNKITQATSFLNVWHGIRIFVALIVGSIIMYVANAIIAKRRKQREKEKFFEKFENAPQIFTISMEAQILSVPSVSALDLRTGKKAMGNEVTELRTKET